MFGKTARSLKGHQIKTLIALSGFSILISGCVGLGNSSLPDTFTLTQTSNYQTAQRQGRRQLMIAEPSALKTLDSEQIVVRTSNSALQFLSGAQWNDRLPKIVQNKLLAAFENTGQLAGVGLPGDGLAIDNQLLVTIRAFEIIADGREGKSARAKVEFSVKVLNDRNGVVRANRVFSTVSAINGNSNDIYIAALDAAAGSVIDEIVIWTLPYVR